ncbi:MAG TPA: hypothetical protein VLC55_02980 [Burkholderiales bacterium]|nr:hypothetical protein [Burkholderiales bacterium]
MPSSDDSPVFRPLCNRVALHPAEPLHRRVPKRDASGRAYGDFMMLIPGLRARPRHVIEATVRELELALARLGPLVVFADFNLRLNLLWVTVVPGRDIGLRVAAAIHARVPEAKLVAAQVEYV